jgi:hypothetical protein
VQNGFITPFRKFLDGAESVDVTIVLHDDGSIFIVETIPVINPKEWTAEDEATANREADLRDETDAIDNATPQEENPE